MILAVNCYSVNLATNVQNIFTAAKLVAIAIIVGGGAYKLALGIHFIKYIWFYNHQLSSHTKPDYCNLTKYLEILKFSNFPAP